MSRSYYSLLGVLAASLFLSLLFCPPFQTGTSDKDVFAYAGWAVLHGQVPYRDFFDHKPPLIYFFNAAGLLLGGTWGIWTIDAVLALLATALFFRLNQKYRLPFPWLLPLLFNLMVRDFLISDGIGLTREYTAFFYLLFFCVGMGASRYRHLLLGFLTGLIFFIQQEQVLAVVPFLLYALIEEPQHSIVRRLLFLAAGFLTVALPLVLYFAAHHALTAFWQDAFVFNTHIYTTQAKSLGAHLQTIKHVLDASNYEVPVLTALCIAVAALIGRSKRKGLILAALIGLVLTLAPEFMGGRYKDYDHPVDFFYYFVPLSAAVCVLLFTVWAYPTEVTPPTRIAWLPYAGLLCCSLVYTAIQHATHLKRDDSAIADPGVNYLRTHPPGNYQLYVFARNEDYTSLYYEFKVLSPSRWIYQHLWNWYENWDADGQQLRAIGADLLAHHTTYVLLDTAPGLFRDPALGNWWMSFMRTHYQPVQLSDNSKMVLWRLNDPQK